MQLEKEGWIKKTSERIHFLNLSDNGFHFYKLFASSEAFKQLQTKC